MDVSGGARRCGSECLGASSQTDTFNAISGSMVKSCYVKCWFGVVCDFFGVFFFNTVAFLVKMHFKMSKHSAIVWSY